ncbi:unnamed protein product [Discula destructiva]
MLSRVQKRTGGRTGRAPLSHPGIYVPVEGEREGHSTNHVRREVPTITALDQFALGINEPLVHLAENGFVLLKLVAVSTGPQQDGHKVIQIVQSRATGEIFVNKILWWSRRRQFGAMSLPLELRVSTLRPRAVGDDGVPQGSAKARAGLLPDVPYINQLRFWQRLKPEADNRHRMYSMFFEFCNGGTIGELMEVYQNELLAIPEEFIWHVAEQLFWTIVTLRFGKTPDDQDSDYEPSEADEESENEDGIVPGWKAASSGSDGGGSDSSDDESVASAQTGDSYLGGDVPDYDDEAWDATTPDDGNAKTGWKRIYHRDLVKNNVFIHYPPRSRGRLPSVGDERNAFPQIVVGDSGNSAMEFDDPDKLPLSLLVAADGVDEDEAFLEDWEDIYFVGCILREMTMTHVAFGATGAYLDGAESARPDNMSMATVNALGTAPPYSAALMNMLKDFEWPGQGQGGSVRELDDDTLFNTFPTAEDILGYYLFTAQAQVANFRDRTGKATGYIDSIDVSWTKPSALTAFEYSLKHATVAGDRPRGRAGKPPGFPQPKMPAVPRADAAEHAKMERLGNLHRWDSSRPYVRAVAVTFEDGMADCTMLPRPPG